MGSDMHRSRVRDRSGKGSASFSPLALFSNGEQGMWYDPSDLTSMFQDSAGTTPVTAAGQPVGLLRDKSGNNNHASQPTAASRPILRNTGALWYLQFDGVDDFMVTANVNFSIQSEMSVFAGVTKSGDLAIGVVAELSASIATNNGTFALLAPGTVAATYKVQFKGTLLSECLAVGYVAPVTNVLVGNGSIGFNQFFRVSGVQTNGDALQGSGSFGNFPVYIGRRGDTTLPFAGFLYGLVIRGKYSSTGDITVTEQYLAGKSGVAF